MIKFVMNGFVEGVSSTVASDFIVENYEVLRKDIIHKFKIVGENATDLLHDVYISMVNKEKHCQGFDETRGITVAQFVYGRIKKYSQNPKYRNNLSEVSSNREIKVIAVEGTVNGKEKLSKLESAYINTESSEYGSILDVEEFESLVDSLWYIEQTNSQIFRLIVSDGIYDLQNISRAELHRLNLTCSRNSKKDSELVEALENVINCRISNIGLFKKVVESFV